MCGDRNAGLGEQRAHLTDLHARHFQRLVRMAERLLPPPHTANAEDVVQTVFAEALAASLRRPELRLGEGWLIRRLRSRIADHHRQSRRQQRLVATLGSAWATPTALEIAIDRATVEELLATIPDRFDRLTLALRIHGYRESEIAARLSVSYEGRLVRDRMKRIRRRVAAHRPAGPHGQAEDTIGPPPSRSRRAAENQTVQRRHSPAPGA